MGDSFKISSPSKGVRTVVLVGRTGNGKSATGNSILGRRAFKSRVSSTGVTKTCEMYNTKLKDGQIVNVIDTPGLFDFSTGSESVGKEITKCIEMAKDGIHAFLVVFSIRTRFSREEGSVIHKLQSLFGNKIIDYLIVVFTGGDELEDNDKTFEDYLGHECPKLLKEIIVECENRCVLFDNKTEDETKITEQFGKLLSLVDSVIIKNGQQPYTHEISELKKQMLSTNEEQFKRINEMGSDHKKTSTKLQQKLATEQAARLKAEEDARLAQKKSNDEILKLRENLNKAQNENKALRN